MKLSVVLSVFNEEKKLERTLESVSFADEIIVIDNGSFDRTLEIEKKYQAKIFHQENRLMLNINKNYGFKKATNDWILNLDADEVVDVSLQEEIQKVISAGEADGYFIPRKNIIFNKWIRHSLWWPDYQLRLFKRQKGKFPCRHIHESLEVEGKTAYLTNSLTHFNYESVSQYLYKLDKIYTESEADLIIKSGKKLVWADVIKMPFSDFIKTFFAQQGFLDGLHGLLLSLLQSFYQIIVFAKVWERQKFDIEEPKNILKSFIFEINKLAKEFRYWQYTSFLNLEKSFIFKLLYRLRRKFDI